MDYRYVINKVLKKYGEDTGQSDYDLEKKIFKATFIGYLAQHSFPYDLKFHFAHPPTNAWGEVIPRTHENYKQELSEFLRMAKEEKGLANKYIESLEGKIARLKKEIEKCEQDMFDLSLLSLIYQGDIDSVNREYSFRKKITNLLKKHNYLTVDFHGDEDVYTTWVYSGDFDSTVDENDPYCDDHFCDSYEEAYDRCLEYIKYHSTWS